MSAVSKRQLVAFFAFSLLLCPCIAASSRVSSLAASPVWTAYVQAERETRNDLSFNPTVRQVCAGGYHTAVLTGEGDIVEWGLVNRGKGEPFAQPLFSTPLLFSEDETVVGIACGPYHTLAWTNVGRLFGWGRTATGSALGQVFTGEDGSTGDFFPPRLIAPGINVSRAAVGYEHTIILDQQGRVYALGESGTAALGLPELGSAHPTTSVVSSPSLVRGLEEFIIADVCAGGQHSVVLTSDGQVLTFGSPSFGALGRNTTENLSASQPGLVPLGTSVRASSIACGGDHTVVKTFEIDKEEAESSAQSFVVFGWNEYGQLGLGNRANEVRALMVVPAFADVGASQVRAVGGAYAHTLWMDIEESKPRLFGSGNNENGELGVEVDYEMEGQDVVDVEDTALDADEFDENGENTFKSSSTPPVSKIICEPSPVEFSLPGSATALISVAGGFKHTVVAVRTTAANGEGSDVVLTCGDDAWGQR